MRVKVEFLGFHFAIEHGEFEVNLMGNTMSDLIKELSKNKKVKEAILNADGKIDEEVLVVLNGENLPSREKIDTVGLKHGDTVTLMLMAGGG